MKPVNVDDWLALEAVRWISGYYGKACGFEDNSTCLVSLDATETDYSTVWDAIKTGEHIVKTYADIVDNSDNFGEKARSRSTI